MRNVDNGERRSDGIVGTSSGDDNLDKREGESGGRVKILNYDERGQVDTWDGKEVDKVEIVSLECGAKNNDLGSLLCSEKREFCENVRGTVSEVNWKAKTDTETECPKVDNMSFAFDSNSNFSSTSNLRDRENEEKSGCHNGMGSTKIGKEAEEMKYNNTSFLFCSSSISNLNSNTEKKKPSGNLDKLVSDVVRKLKVESETDLENMEADPFEFQWLFFVFRMSSYTECKEAKCQDEKKQSSEKFGDFKTNSESSSCCHCSRGPYVASDRINGVNRENSGQNHFLFGNDSNTKGATIGISSSKKFTFAESAESVDASQFTKCQVNHNTLPNIDAAAPTCSCSSLSFQPNDCVSEVAFVDGVTRKDDVSFTGTTDGLGCALKTLRANLFPELNKTSEFVTNGRSVRDKRSRKQRGKSKKPSLSKQWPGQDHVPKESSSQEHPKPCGCYSPMDFSSNEETRVVDPHSRGHSVTSTDPLHLVSQSALCASDETVHVDPKGESLAATGSRLGETVDQICKEPIKKNSMYHGEGVFYQTARAGIGLNIEKQESGSRTPLFTSGFENDKCFTFLTSSSAQGSSMMGKCPQRRKKNRMKVDHVTFIITASPNVEFGSFDLFTPHSSTALCFDVVGKSEANEQFKQVHVSSSVATHETCEKWRIRGNEAYKNGDLSKAEDFCTHGIISIPSNERAGCSLKPLLLCYSSRAATMMCLGRIRYEEAIRLCEQSMAFADSNFSGYEIYQSYFHLGRLEAALDLLNKLEKVGSTKEMYASKKLESSVPLSVTIHELLRHKVCTLLKKNAGNEAFRSGSYTEAVEHYTVALSSNVGSRPFSAICLCNRGAAHQALGQITDAIADGSLAIALDGNYVKAVSRRATLHEMIQDHGESAGDLQRLVSILENQSNDMAKESGSLGRSSGSVKELRDGHRCMHLMEEAKKGISLDFYLILHKLQIKLHFDPTNLDMFLNTATLQKLNFSRHSDKIWKFFGYLGNEN
ncbi:unnamed protein product [Malus baccata var. baccata]